MGGVCLLCGKSCIGAEPVPALPLGAAEEEALGHTDSSAETAPPGAHAELHYPPGEAQGRGGAGGGPRPQAHSPPPQEHYMASLMPLQKSITPWKVRVQVAVWGGPGREGGRRSRGVQESRALGCPHTCQTSLIGQKNGGHT